MDFLFGLVTLPFDKLINEDKRERRRSACIRAGDEAGLRLLLGDFVQLYDIQGRVERLG